MAGRTSCRLPRQRRHWFVGVGPERPRAVCRTMPAWKLPDYVLCRSSGRKQPLPWKEFLVTESSSVMVTERPFLWASLMVSNQLALSAPAVIEKLPPVKANVICPDWLSSMIRGTAEFVLNAILLPPSRGDRPPRRDSRTVDGAPTIPEARDV